MNRERLLHLLLWVVALVTSGLVAAHAAFGAGVCTSLAASRLSGGTAAYVCVRDSGVEFKLGAGAWQPTGWSDVSDVAVRVYGNVPGRAVVYGAAAAGTRQGFVFESPLDVPAFTWLWPTPSGRAAPVGIVTGADALWVVDAAGQVYGPVSGVALGAAMPGVFRGAIGTSTWFLTAGGALLRRVTDDIADPVWQAPEKVSDLALVVGIPNGDRLFVAGVSGRIYLVDYVGGVASPLQSVDLLAPNVAVLDGGPVVRVGDSILAVSGWQPLGGTPPTATRTPAPTITRTPTSTKTPTHAASACRAALQAAIEVCP